MDVNIAFGKIIMLHLVDENSVWNAFRRKIHGADDACTLTSV